MRNHALWRLVRQVVNVIAATCAAMAVLFVCAAGFWGVPALGRALDPGNGAWTSAVGGRLPASRTLRLPGIVGGATVSFGSHGIAAVNAANEGDAIVALGYLHASFRLAEMDLARRLAEGRLAQLVGSSAVRSDEFELRLGLLRTAQREWAEMPKDGIEARLLESYSIGVNDYLGQLRKNRQWPAIFSLAGVYPADWTPVDSLAVQGELTQELDYTTTPLDYTLLARSLGMTRTMRWFPVLPVNKQNPYDPGPYHPRRLAPLTTTMTTTVSRRPAREIRGTTVAAGLPSVPPAGVAQAAAAMLAQTRALPPGQIHGYPDSNAWAANGPKVSGGGSMLAGDPHLPQTLPSIWFEVAISAPGFYVSGVGVPGLPGVLIGRNRHIAWSLTDTQNQATLFYAERTSKAHPGQYFWRGKWRAMRQVNYTISVRGGAARHLTVNLTVHGPVMTRAGQTVSVDWMGNVPSPDVAVLQQISVAHNFSQFRAALASWRAPAQNFVYADNRGNIGAISAGYYPIVAGGTPWLPMPGTGTDDVVGVIPYTAVPQSYDPPGHVIATANQRPVTAAYPYYIGTTANFFDPGYRASREYAFLDRRSNLTMSGFAALQNNLVDGLAVRLLPSIDKLLRGSAVPTRGGDSPVPPAVWTPMDKQALALLRGWNYSMDPHSAAASIWWALWTDYVYTTFEPWWRSARVPVSLDRTGLAPSTGQASLVEVLERWTLTDQANPAFSPPGNPPGTAASVLRAAFATAVAQLHGKLGGGPSSWTWGKLHSRKFPSLLRAPGLGYGPQAAGGDPWSVDAADGLPVSEAGPSWRMIVQPGTAGHSPPTGWGIYPGGQSENPASPWYENLVADWWNGRYLPMPSAGPAVVRGNVLWELEP
ncbi:MAG TPA: penicillin acylase family protein [Streptosporangiaceae bacterium]|nr:penicillin acylase family protein [Streptosporangiaceae bacterium]